MTLHRRIGFYLLLAASLLATAFVSTSRATSYNFYFNNTEQGANSSATPTVVVRDDSAGKTIDLDKKSQASQALATPTLPTQSEAAPVSPPKQEATPISPPALATETAAAPILTAEAPKHEPFTFKGKLRLTTSAVFLPPSQLLSYYDKSGVARTDNEGYGFSFGLTLLPFRMLGINVYGGAYEHNREKKLLHPFGGAEFEFIPVHLSLGRFKDLLEAGALLGFAKIGDGDVFDSPVGHWGVRGTLNLGAKWGLTAAYRMNIDLHYAQAEGGLSVRL